MKIYLVGGAVRDQLLDLPVIEKDWVVVGSTPEHLLKQGYKSVGKDFPVFIHPKTKEEYALARTERKVAPGYTGFEFHAAKEVTLVQDLQRRDLTINAIAQDEDGTLIDPYNGQQDIESRFLRHVSDAFSEDPVRILRVARFAARFHHLGFRVAPETLQLMQQMVEHGEVNSLVGERVWKETRRALMEPNPDIFFTTLRQCGALASVFPEIDALFGVPQRPEYHPEIDTGIHVMMTLQQIHKLNGSLAARFATLLHDLGKAVTPKELLPSHPRHEERSVPLVKKLCKRLAVPKYEKELALGVAEFHLLCHRAQELKPNTILKLFSRLDAFRKPEKFEEFLLCCEADSRGRTGSENSPYQSRAYLQKALEACNTLDTSAIVANTKEGSEIGLKINSERVKLLTQFKSDWQLAHQ